MCRRWGTPQNFFLALIDELKNNYLLKKLLKWVNKNRTNFNIYTMLYFFKKIKKNTRKYHYFKYVYQKA